MARDGKLWVCIGLCWWLMGCAASVDAPGLSAPQFNITIDGAGNRVLPGQDGVFDVYSPGGIGGATIQVTDGTPLPRVILRLHLAGLEELRIGQGETQLGLAVSSRGEGVVYEALLSADGQEQPIGPDHPLWLTVTRLEADAAAVNKADADYFQIILPPIFLQAVGDTLSLHWIDFYRG